MALPIALIAAAGVLKLSSQMSATRDKSTSLKLLSKQILEEGRINAKDFERQSSAIQAEGKNIRSASGVQLNTGTALIVDENIVREIAIGKSRILQDAVRRAAAIERERKAVKRGGKFAAAGTLLQTGGSMFG